MQKAVVFLSPYVCRWNRLHHDRPHDLCFIEGRTAGRWGEKPSTKGEAPEAECVGASLAIWNAFCHNDGRAQGGEFRQRRPIIM